MRESQIVLEIAVYFSADSVLASPKRPAEPLKRGSLQWYLKHPDVKQSNLMAYRRCSEYSFDADRR